MDEKMWRSWNKLISHAYNDLYEPKTELELTSAIKKSKNIKVIGTGQSSSDIVAGTTSLISLRYYNKIISVDNHRFEITAQSGVILSDLMKEIEGLGWSLPALPDIDTITLGGAIATGTHGTGNEAHILSSYMTRCRLITADGGLKEIHKNSAILDALRVSLGVLGVMSTITIRCEPKFYLDIIEKPVKDEEWLSSFRADLNHNFFYRILWLPHTGYGYVIKGNKTPSQGNYPEKSPWHLKHRRKVSHFLYKLTNMNPYLTPIANRVIKKLFFAHEKRHTGTLYEATVTKSRSSQIELSEWTVSIDDFKGCFMELKTALDSFDNDSFAHIPMDIRFLSRDESWLSYAYKKDIVTIGCVTRTPEHSDRYNAFRTIEKIFKKYGARPHWAKRHAMKGDDFRKVYPRWDDFLSLRKKMDGKGKFLNPYLKKIFK